tara:strand:- start:473 stop:868 length:396 start_codon:yes stop_codon:yes gene_type:complete
MSVENPINKSGQLGQTRLREFLIEDNFSYREEKTGQHQIDFIVNPGTNKEIYIDVTNQNTDGSVDEKIPHKVWKYHNKYKYKDVYIVEGKYNVSKKVKEHCKIYDFNVHFVKLEEMKSILKNKNYKIERFF